MRSGVPMGSCFVVGCEFDGIKLEPIKELGPPAEINVDLIKLGNRYIDEYFLNPRLHQKN